MKKTIVATLMAVLLISGLLVGCGDVVTGSGNLDTEEFNFSSFTRVEVGHAFEVEVVQSDSYSVSITADDMHLTLLLTERLCAVYSVTA